MKKSRIYTASCALLAALTLTPTVFADPVSANEMDTITIVNHYPLALELSIENGNPQVTPQLPKQSSLASGSQVTSTVTAGEPKANQVYIYAHSTDVANIFWSVAKDQVRVYLQKGIAYSISKTKQATLTFCTTEEYRAEGHC